VSQFALDMALTAARRRFSERRPRSLDRAEAASRSLPGGNTRTSLCHGPPPLFVARGEGARGEGSRLTALAAEAALGTLPTEEALESFNHRGDGLREPMLLDLAADGIHIAPRGLIALSLAIDEQDTTL